MPRICGDRSDSWCPPCPSDDPRSRAAERPVLLTSPPSRERRRLAPQRSGGVFCRGAIALGVISDRAIADAEIAQRVLELSEVRQHRAPCTRFVPVMNGVEDRPVQIVNELRRIRSSCRVLKVEACGECIIE